MLAEYTMVKGKINCVGGPLDVYTLHRRVGDEVADIKEFIMRQPEKEELSALIQADKEKLLSTLVTVEEDWQEMKNLPETSGASARVWAPINASGRSCCNKFRNGDNYRESWVFPDGAQLEIRPARGEYSGEHHFHSDTHRQWRWTRIRLTDKVDVVDLTSMVNQFF